MKTEASPENLTPKTVARGEAPIMRAGVKLSAEEVKKIDEGWEFVEVPETDLYDYKFEGFWINGTHFKPGKHLLPPDWANEAKRILKVWEVGNRRMLRPTPHKTTLDEVQRGMTGANVGAPAPEAN